VLVKKGLTTFYRLHSHSILFSSNDRTEGVLSTTLRPTLPAVMVEWLAEVVDERRCLRLCSVGACKEGFNYISSSS